MMAEQMRANVTGQPDMSGKLSGAPAVSDYEKLIHKPSINDIELSGNKSAEDLGLASKQELENLERRFDDLVDGNEVAY